MNKFYILAVLATISTGISECKPQIETAYFVPEQYTGDTRKNMVAMLEYGQKLYKLKCSRCHGIFTKGKDSIPNFSKTQIENYRSAALMEDSSNHAVIQKITPYDLDMILQFLSFRKVKKEN